jgi:drug/metabolite transporter (DMT)-like permease
MNETHVDNPLRIALVITASTVFLGIMNLFVKLAAEQLPIPQIMFFRSLLGVFPVLFLLWQRQDWNLIKTHRIGAHFVRSFVGFVSMCAFFWAFAMLPLANATAIQFATPLIVTALSVVLLDERVGPHRWTAVLIGLGAVLFMLQPAGANNMLGSLVAICAATLSAFVVIIIRKLGNSEHSLTIVFYFTLICALLSGIWMAFVWKTPDTIHWIYLIAIGLLGGCGQICTTYAYARAPLAFVSPFTYFTIIVSVILDLAVWHIFPSWQLWVGSTIVIASGLYIVLRESRKHYQATATPEVADVPPPVPTEKDIEDPV